MHFDQRDLPFSACAPFVGVDTRFGVLFGVVGHRATIAKSPQVLLTPEGFLNLVSFVETSQVSPRLPLRVGSFPLAGFLQPVAIDYRPWPE